MIALLKTTDNLKTGLLIVTIIITRTLRIKGEKYGKERNLEFY